MKFPVFQLAGSLDSARDKLRLGKGWYSGIPVFLALLGATPSALAATPDVTIRLRPHCPTETACREFTLYDNETMITNGLKAGDTLDLDVVLTNPSIQPIQSVQSWLTYDSTALQGLDVRIADDFPLVAPGEQAFLDAEGVVKLGASNVGGGMTATEIVFARVQFQVLSPKEEPAFVRFREFSLLGQEGKTKALVVEGGRTVNILKTRPKDLRLHFGEDPPPSILPSPIPTPAPGTTPLPIPTPTLIPPDGFSRIQPDGLRVTTERALPSPDGLPRTGVAYLIWNALPDPQVRGYNVYYGTVSGRYVQRRTVSAGDIGTTIRGLPADTRYYFAITAFNALQQETDFSNEVAVVIGDPLSSTAPFTVGEQSTVAPDDAPLFAGTAPLPAGRIPARTGPPFSVLIAAVLVAAGFGVFFMRLFRNTRS